MIMINHHLFCKFKNNFRARPLVITLTIYYSSIPSIDAEGCEGGAA